MTLPKIELQETYRSQAQMFANKVKKRFKHLRKRFAEQNIDVFRLYDWDIPEIRAAVDWYAGHLVIAEYKRKQSTPEWLPMMGAAVAEALNVPAENVHLKERFMGAQEGNRYERLDYTDQKIVVSERDFLFYVNLWDYVDTGLFSDHRNTRKLVREQSEGGDFLNLYCYTGSFSCYAAKGGARTTVSVDRSETALRWARENMNLNGIDEAANTLIQADTFDFLKNAEREHRTFDLAVVDPPSFSTSREKTYAFDISADHSSLLSAVVSVMNAGATIFFSTNHQNFELHLDRLEITDAKEITAVTIPEDYVSKKKTIHRCWNITV
jgi:23S rRNA G2069 N7-methylase RlmK/C1962 C5-methylase RlmI